MQLSIIIINWNSAHYLENCLRSIFSTLKDISFEVIVIDNASTESLADVKREFSQARFIENDLNVGFSKANNQGASMATGEVLLFINPDTIVKDNALNLLYACIVLQGYAAAGPKLLKKSGEIQWMCARNLFSISGEFFNLFLLERLFPKNRLFGKNLMTYWDHLSSREVEAISGACLMIRKDFFDKIRGFDEEYFYYGEDVDLCHKILINHQKIYYCSQAEVVHFGKGSSDASNQANTLYATLLFNSTRRYFKKNFWGWKFILFDFIAICAAIFRIFVILILWPFLGRKRTSDFNKKTLKKYVFILGIALGIVKNAKLRDLFMSSHKQAALRKTILFFPGFSPHSLCVVEEMFNAMLSILKNEHNIYVWTSSKNALYLKHLSADITVIKESSRGILRFFRLLEAIRKYKIDLLHGQFGPDRYIIGFAAKILGIHVSLYEHWISVKGKMGWIKKYYYKYFIDAFNCNSNFTRNSLLSAGVPESKTIVVYHAKYTGQLPSEISDQQQEFLRAGLSIDPATIVIGMVSGFRPEKHIEDIIRIFSDIKREYPNTALLLVGKDDNDIAEEAKKLVNLLSLNNSVIFTGYRNDVQNLYQIMDIFAFTSIDEPWGNVIHEAMACGLPVVAYDSGGYVEIIKNEKNAFLVKPRDLRGFKAILTKLITNEQLRLAVGKQAAQDVVNHPLLQFSHIVDACCNFVRKNI